MIVALSVGYHGAGLDEDNRCRADRAGSPASAAVPQGVVAARGSRTLTLVRVRTAEGAIGYGAMGGDARGAVAAVEPALLGADSACLQAHAPAVEAAGGRSAVRPARQGGRAAAGASVGMCQDPVSGRTSRRVRTAFQSVQTFSAS